MEHLLSGAAAVEEKSKSGDESAPSASEQAAASSPSSSSSSSAAFDAMKNEPPLAGAASAHMLPKLPPISSLTSHLHSVPPPLQSSQVPFTVVPMRTVSRSSAASAAHDDGHCRYRNKLCMHPRALKRNGELHNLCEKHRAKANQNQRKLESKRRVQKRQGRQPSASATPRSYQFPAPGPTALHAGAMQINHEYQQQQQLGGLRGAPGVLPSLAQISRPPPPAGPSSAPGYPYYDNSQYPPYSR